MPELNLALKQISLGTHQTVWDLRVLLFKGATSIKRNEAMQAIQEGKCGNAIEERFHFVIKAYQVFNVSLVRGDSVHTVIGLLSLLWRFFKWVDDNSKSITIETAIDVFKRWTEHLLFRVNHEKDISPRTAYKSASKLSNLIARILNIPGPKPGKGIMQLTRMRMPPRKKKILSTKDYKEKTVKMFEFGRILTRVCNSLDIQTIRGELPVTIEINESKSLSIMCGLWSLNYNSSVVRDESHIRKLANSRRPLLDSENILDSYKRSQLVNLRVECELLIFIAQTGMNLTQASNLERESYRWKSDSDSFDVFRVYKGRRKGEAIFRCFNSYREHLQRYLIWLDDIGFSIIDNRLFPHLTRSIIPSREAERKFRTSRELFKKNNLPFISPNELRNNRINWLLDYTQDVKFTADLMGHTTAVLNENYEIPNHQRASIEIIQFHDVIEENASSPGPGVCVDLFHQPKNIENLAINAPTPDCISPEGCLFCVNHRDIMSSEYCWKLVSHAYIKELETGLYIPSKEKLIHPAYRVIDLISQKLNAISESNKVRAVWVKDAKDLVRAGRYHPHWDSYIKLIEEMV